MTLPKTLIICTSHRAPMQETQLCMQKASFPNTILSGVSDTALARNVSFTTALIAADKDDYEMFVFVDDDMVFAPETVDKLVAYAVQLERATSALYMTQEGLPALGCVHNDPDWKKCLWNTGLGMIAISAKELRELADNSESLKTPMGNIYAFTWSGPHEGLWSSEDYTFCRRLGGVKLAPLSAGHIKPRALWPVEGLIDEYIHGN